MAKISISENNVLFPIPKTLYGAFLEDINFTLDGGLNANMLFNPSFDCVFKGSPLHGFPFFFSANHPVLGVHKGLKGYKTKGKIKILPNKEYGGYCAFLSAGSILFNDGYTYTVKKNAKASIAIKEGHTYKFSCLAKADQPAQIEISVSSPNGALSTLATVTVQGGWEKHEVLIDGVKTGLGTAVIKAKNAVYLDSLCLMDEDCWHKDDPKYTQGKFRKDLVEALENIHPGLIRFPGGTLTDGVRQGEEYHWKDTVGPIEKRKPALNNIWDRKNNFTQSYQIGFYELFCLCEDLHAEPLPVVFAGQCFFNTLFGDKPGIDIDSEAFNKRVIQNAMDLIDYANGDPATNKWAKIRAEAGHPAPFNLKYLSIGNENSGVYYLKAFRKAYEVIHQAHPEIKLVLSVGMKGPKSESAAYSWNQARENDLDVLVDDHFYDTPEWCFQNADFFEKRPLEKQKTFIGEYSARGHKGENPNTYLSAVAEAAMMIDYERGADRIQSACFAPLYNNVHGTVWNHNLIDFDNFQYIQNCNYLMQMMFSSNVGTSAIKASSETEIHGIFFSATADEDFIYFKLVNSLDKEEKTTLNLSGKESGTVEILTLDSPNLESRNTLQLDGTSKTAVSLKKFNIESKDGLVEFTANPKSAYVLKIGKK
jgi:alpha-N-arabinofuranosidase